MALPFATIDPVRVEDEAKLRRPSFNEVYASCFRKVFSWVRAHGCADADVEDLVQEIFVIVQRKLPDFDGSHLSGWLYRITARTVRDHRRSAWFRNLFARPSNVEVDELDHARPGAPELIEERDARRVLHTLVAQLSPKWRSAFVLFEIEGVSGEEIAALEGISVAALWTRLHRARNEFAALVAQRLEKEER
jgi:RNA polymerase sigma-70 factor (ECF subfamily)